MCISIIYGMVFFWEHSFTSLLMQLGTEQLLKISEFIDILLLVIANQQLIYINNDDCMPPIWREIMTIEFYFHCAIMLNNMIKFELNKLLIDKKKKKLNSLVCIVKSVTWFGRHNCSYSFITLVESLSKYSPLPITFIICRRRLLTFHIICFSHPNTIYGFCIYFHILWPLYSKQMLTQQMVIYDSFSHCFYEL